MYSPLNILSVESWWLLVTILVLVRYYVYREWKCLENLGIPHDKPSVLQLGHARTLTSERTFTVENENKKKFGPIWGFYLGLKPRIMIHDPEILQKIYTTEFPNFINRQTDWLPQMNGKEMDKSLIVLSNDQWRRVRSTMTPSFSSSKLRQMVAIIDWCTENTIEVLNKKNRDGDGSFKATDVFPRLSMDVICSSAFSTNVNSQDDTMEEPEITLQAKLFVEGFFSRIFFLCLTFPFLRPFGTRYLGNRSHIIYIRNLANHIIETRRKEWNSQDRVDLMRLMMESEVPDKVVQDKTRKGMTRLEIIGNSISMIMAGYETTGNTMACLAYNMAMYPKIQSQVQEEIDEMIRESGKIDFDGVNGLKLLDMCVNETLRLYSPVGRTIRTAGKEMTINGLTIPAGMVLAVPIYALSHDPEYWDNPMEFKPERMRDMSQINPMVFQPFGAGPRKCIGMRFAMTEVKMAFCKLLHTFTFQPTADTPKPPLKMRFSVTNHTDAFFLRAFPRQQA